MSRKLKGHLVQGTRLLRRADIKTCAECTEYSDPRTCKKYNNFMSRLFGLVFNSDRAACIAQIKQLGLGGHATAMAKLERPVIKR